MLQVADAGSAAAADRGLQKEFEAIIAAVIGGCLLTGGYGSVIGAALGALIFGVVQIGIGYTSIDNNWYRVFLGGMLLDCGAVQQLHPLGASLLGVVKPPRETGMSRLRVHSPARRTSASTSGR